MTDKLHESLSSVMDAAADDLELPRLLSAMQTNEVLSKALRDKWRRYHLAQGVLRGDLRNMSDPVLARVDISAAVMARLEAETSAEEVQPDLQVQTKAPTLAAVAGEAPLKREDRHSWWRGGALAASVALLVITGVQIYNTSTDGPQPGASSTPMAAQPVTNPAQMAPRLVAEAPQPFARVSRPVSDTPLSPQAFTGRSLVSFATSQSEPLDSARAETLHRPMILAPQGMDR